jgi:hypothetical protein
VRRLVVAQEERTAAAIAPSKAIPIPGFLMPRV